MFPGVVSNAASGCLVVGVGRNFNRLQLFGPLFSPEMAIPPPRDFPLPFAGRVQDLTRYWYHMEGL